MMIGSGETLRARLVQPTLFVYGDVPEIAAQHEAWSVVHVRPGEAPPAPLGAVLVFDLRAVPLDELARLRGLPLLVTLPLLLVADGPVPESTFALLGADDDVAPAVTGAATLARRLALLCETARLRHAAFFAQQALEQSVRALVEQQRFDHAILNGVQVGIITTDDAGVVTFMNRSAAALLQLRVEQTGCDVQQLLALSQSPPELLAGQTRRTLAYPLITPEGDELDLELAVSRGEGGSDERVGFFFIFRDVREEKQRESEQARFQRLVAMGTMVAGFAHEVRNPVAALRSIAEELVEELRDAGVKVPHVRLMLQMVERIERLVRTSLQFGRPAPPRRSPQRPWIIVSSAITELHPRLRALGHDIVLEIEPDLPDVNVDEKQIAQALVILLNNALDATGNPSRVVTRLRSARAADEVRGRQSEPPMTSMCVRFEVIDDGAGIPADILDRIFDPFFTTKPSGTGLGLSIAQQIVNENGGRLEVSSSPGARTSFSIIVA